VARQPPAIRVDARYTATPERVFKAWLDPDIAGRWLFATATRPAERVEIGARVGGPFRFAERREDGDVEHCGAYIEIVPPRSLVFSLALADRPRVVTRVSVEIEPRAAGCRLALAHENVPDDLVSSTETRWSGMLYGLGVILDSFAGDSTSEKRATAANVVPRHLTRARARGRREFQPPQNPRSE